MGRRPENPEKKRERMRVYRATHAEQIREQRAAYRASHKEEARTYQETYYAENAEQLREKARIAGQERRERMGDAYRLEQRMRDRDRRAYLREWSKSPAGRASAAHKRQRDRQNGAEPARRAVDEALRLGKLVRQPCQECGTPKGQAHHFLGYAPEHRLDIQWLCRTHHELAHHPMPTNPFEGERRRDWQ